MIPGSGMGQLRFFFNIHSIPLKEEYKWLLPEQKLLAIFAIRFFEFFATGQAIVPTINVGKESPDSTEQCTTRIAGVRRCRCFHRRQGTESATENNCSSLSFRRGLGWVWKCEVRAHSLYEWLYIRVNLACWNPTYSIVWGLLVRVPIYRDGIQGRQIDPDG